MTQARPQSETRDREWGQQIFLQFERRISIRKAGTGPKLTLDQSLSWWYHVLPSTLGW